MIRKINKSNGLNKHLDILPTLPNPDVPDIKIPESDIKIDPADMINATDIQEGVSKLMDNMIVKS